MNPVRVDAIVDLAYGALIVLSIVLIATVETDVGIAFGVGVFASYVVHVVWKMARFDPDWMTQAVEETVEEQVEAVQTQVEETVEKQVEGVQTQVEEVVEESVEETVEREVEAVQTQVEDVKERVERRPRESEIEEIVEESVGDDAGEE